MVLTIKVFLVSISNLIKKSLPITWFWQIAQSYSRYKYVVVIMRKKSLSIRQNIENDVLKGVCGDVNVLTVTNSLLSYETPSFSCILWNVNTFFSWLSFRFAAVLTSQWILKDCNGHLLFIYTKGGHEI